VIRVVYNSQKRPPAPFVLLRLANPHDGTAIADVPAQLDTAADRTVIPVPLLESMGLEPVDDMLIGGLGGTEEKLPIFVVSLAIFSLHARDINVIGHPEEPLILLGRDVLNSHRLLLDGPNLVFEID
jgi:hypothetical protein